MSVGFLFFHFKNPKRALGGEENFQRPGGRRDRRRGKRSSGGGGGTADGGRRRRGSDLQQMGWLPSTILPFLALFIAISLRYGNRFHFLVIYRIFCFIFWEFKNGSRVWIFC